MGTALIGRGVRVEIGKTEGTAKSVSAITQADPGVATSTAHGLAAKSVGYFQDTGATAVAGMVQLAGQAVRLGTADTNTFALEDIDTSDYAALSGTPDFVPITAWETLARAASYGIGGGEASAQNNSVLLDDIEQEISGLLAAQSVTINLKKETTSDAGLALVRKAARSSAWLVVRITLKDGATRVFRGQPSLPGEDVQQGQIGTGTFSFKVKGFVTEGAA